MNSLNAKNFIVALFIALAVNIFGGFLVGFFGAFLKIGELYTGVITF